ncbi:unnamed protein product [Amoebophrya sp. A120]|nr:unnamed protein product [Amoebophrya sp. A120]|eukprot:GSA120T00014728001.1
MIMLNTTEQKEESQHTISACPWPCRTENHTGRSSISPQEEHQQQNCMLTKLNGETRKEKLYGDVSTNMHNQGH